MEQTLELTILMPCLNEEKTLGACIQEAQQFIACNHLVGEVLIADNGSQDQSVAIAKRMGARVVEIVEKGYGNALRGGIEVALGHYIIMGDCDMSYDFANLLPFLEKLREGNDLVMGNRFKGGIEKHAMPFWHRYLGVPVLSLVGRWVYKVSSVGDFHCGLRGFNKVAIQDLHLKGEGMEFATEMIGAFVKNKAKIIEIPTVLRKDGRSGKSHLMPIRDGLRHLALLMKERI